MATTTHLVLGDQLTRTVGPLAHDAPQRVLMIESRALLREPTIHAQIHGANEKPHSSGSTARAPPRNPQ